MNSMQILIFVIIQLAALSLNNIGISLLTTTTSQTLYPASADPL